MARAPGADAEERAARRPGLRGDALATLRAWSSPDEHQERLRREFVEHLVGPADDSPAGLLREPWPDHLTVSVLVLSADGDEVLLTLHGKARRWFQLGGHLERDDAGLRAAALREAREESGLPRLRLSATPARLDLHPVPFCHPDGTARHLDVQYVAVAARGARPRISAESADLQWWPVDGLPTREASLLALVDAARRAVDDLR